LLLYKQEAEVLIGGRRLALYQIKGI